jgi:hypothetical protein
VSVKFPSEPRKQPSTEVGLDAAPVWLELVGGVCGYVSCACSQAVAHKSAKASVIILDMGTPFETLIAPQCSGVCSDSAEKVL